MVKRIVGLYLVLIAALVAIHTVVEPLYHVSTLDQPYSPVWPTFDILMAIAMVLAIVFAFLRKRVVDGEGVDASVSREYIAANAVFYGLIAVAILFFWSYFNLLSEAYNPTGSDAESVLWMIVDASMPLVLGAQGVFLMRRTE